VGDRSLSSQRERHPAKTTFGQPSVGHAASGKPEVHPGQEKGKNVRRTDNICAPTRPVSFGPALKPTTTCFRAAWPNKTKIKSWYETTPLKRSPGLQRGRIGEKVLTSEEGLLGCV